MTKLHRLTVTRKHSRINIKGQIIILKLINHDLTFTSGQSTYPCNQLFRFKRLCHVIIGTAIKPCNLNSQADIIIEGTVTLEDNVQNSEDYWTDQGYSETDSEVDGAENAVVKLKGASKVTMSGDGTLNITANAKNGIKSGATLDSDLDTELAADSTNDYYAYLTMSDLNVNIDAANVYKPSSSGSTQNYGPGGQEEETYERTYPTLSGSGFVFDNSEKKWSTVNAYVYDDSGTSVVENAKWPGVTMTDCGNDFWKYELDSKFTGDKINVIFNNGSEQIPGAMESGYAMTSSDKMIYENGTWKTLSETSDINLTLTSSADSVNVGEYVTITAAALVNNSTVSTTNLTLGDTLVIKGAASGGSGSYSYAYYYKRQGNSLWRAIGTEFGTATSASLKPTDSEGVFDIKVIIKDNQTEETVTKNFTVTVTN